MARMFTKPACCCVICSVIYWVYTQTSIPFIIRNEKQKGFVLQIKRRLVILFIHPRADLTVVFWNCHVSRSQVASSHANSGLLSIQPISARNIAMLCTLSLFNCTGMKADSGCKPMGILTFFPTVIFSEWTKHRSRTLLSPSRTAPIYNAQVLPHSSAVYKIHLHFN
jgi:hypothetical protein